MGYFPPGDDSKHHIMLIKGILTEKKIPTYYYLYPEIKIYYPQGYHSIIANIFFISNYNLFKTIFFFGVFFYCLTAFSFYYCGKIIFNERVGLISSVLSLTNLMLLKFLTHGMYPNLLGIVLQPIFFAIFFLYVKGKSNVILPAILGASSFLINPYVAFVPFFTIIAFYKKSPFLIFLTFLLISPFLFFYLKEYKQVDIILKGEISKILPLFTLMENVQYFIYNFLNIFIYTPLLVFTLLSFLYLKSKIVRKLFLIWLVSPIILIVFVLFSIYMPPVTKMFPNILLFEDFRMLLHISIPATLLASFSLNFLNKKLKTLIPTIIILLILPSCMKIIRPNELKYQSFTYGDLLFIEWINKNIQNDSIIFNDHFKGTSSTWIPPLTGIKVSSPFLGLPTFNYPFFQNFITIRTIPDSKEGMEILNKFNATYITFSTFFSINQYGYLFPKFDLKKFKEPCYTQLYGSNDNFLFKINYEKCSGENYFKVYTHNFQNLVVNNFPLYYNLSGIKINPALKQVIEPYLFVNFDSESIGDVMVKYGFEDKTDFVEEIIPKRSISKNVFQPVKLPKYFLNEIDPVVWFLGEIKLNNVTLVLRLDEVFKVNDILIFPKPEVRKDRILINITQPVDIILKDFTRHKKLVIVYNDTKGNVDLNFYDNYWKNFYILYRNGTNEIKTVEIPLNITAKLFSISIVPHETDFEIFDVYLKEDYKIVKTILTDPIFIYLNGTKVRINTLEDIYKIPNLEKMSDNLYLQGDWQKTNEGKKLIKGNLNSKILLFNVSEGILKIKYIDRGNGNVDFNFYDSLKDKWREFYVLERNDSLKIIEIEFHIKLLQTNFLVLGVYSHGDDFIIKEVTFYRKL
ncbi:MAG: hypothetical protein QXO40_04560 [Candidatus Aenigmatarchaeota archaeon]